LLTEGGLKFRGKERREGNLELTENIGGRSI